MITNQIEVGVQESAGLEKDETRQALDRMYEDISSIREADGNVQGQMSRFRVICDAPPVTPRCRVIEEPADPKIVSASMKKMNDSNEDLETVLDALSVDGGKHGSKFEKGLAKMGKQYDSLQIEIEKLNELTFYGDPGKSNYDKSKVISETRRIEKLSNEMEKNRKSMERDYGR